jgi:hypothetical protein
MMERRVRFFGHAFGLIAEAGSSVRFAVFDFVFAQIVLRRAVVCSADHRLQAGKLAAGDQAQCATAGAGQNCPVWILRVPQRPCILKHKKRSRFHLLRYPLVEQLLFRLHVLPPLS